jgi:hypothetical protein
VPAHRAPDSGWYLARRRATPRHHPDEEEVSDRRTLVILLAIVVVVVAGTFAVTARWSPDVTPRTAATPPTVSVPPPGAATPSFRAAVPTARGVPHGVATAVLLGPDGAEALASALTTFCRDGTAVVTDGDWTCGGAPIDMDQACVRLYDDDAWAGMLNDDDPQSWRCYRDVS